MTVITCIDDLKTLYKRRVPKMFYDYAETGSWSEQTFRDNTTDFRELKFRQRIAVNMEGRSTSSTMIGEAVTMPVALAPVGLTGMQCADGEIKAARAAGKFGVPFTLSTMSICSIEDVAEATDHPFWFQVYTLKDDDFMRRLMERARAAQCSALVITVDLQMLGQRHKDLKNGLSAPPKLTLKSIADMMTKVSWGLEMLGTKRRFFGNIVGHAKGVSDASSLSSWTAEAFDQTLDWKRIGQLMEMWGGKVILKGILDVDDAKWLQILAQTPLSSPIMGGDSSTAHQAPFGCYPTLWIQWVTKPRYCSTVAFGQDRMFSKRLRLVRRAQ